MNNEIVMFISVILIGTGVIVFTAMWDHLRMEWKGYLITFGFLVLFLAPPLFVNYVERRREEATLRERHFEELDNLWRNTYDSTNHFKQ